MPQQRETCVIPGGWQMERDSSIFRFTEFMSEHACDGDLFPEEESTSCFGGVLDDMPCTFSEELDEGSWAPCGSSQEESSSFLGSQVEESRISDTPGHTSQDCGERDGYQDDFSNLPQGNLSLVLEGQVAQNRIPYTFREWNHSKGTLQADLPQQSLQDAQHNLDVALEEYMNYLTGAEFLSIYPLRFRDRVSQIHLQEVTDFDFLTTHPSLGFWSFKDWAQRTRVWYKKNRYPDLDDYELHRMMVAEYSNGPLLLSFGDSEDFSKLLHDQVRDTKYKLWSLTWSSLGL
jgi:hypothetical protein